MLIESRDLIDRPLDVVYPLLRDNLAALVPHLPNVQRIDQVSHARAADGTVEVVNHWFAIAEVPAAVRKVLKPELFSWKDYATWNDAEHSVRYRLQSFLASDLYDATGVNTLRAVGADRTELHVSCTIDIHADRIPGVPAFVLRRVLPVVEAVIKQLLGPNLRSVGKGVAAYYREQERRATR